MKRVLYIIAFFGFGTQCQAQLALYNSRTLFDAFENPSQSVFQTDSSKRFAFNFFIPTLSLNATIAGSGMPAWRSILINDRNDAENVRLGKGLYSQLGASVNTYLLSLKWFKRVKYQQELGFSWQLRNDTWAKISNNTLGIFDQYDLFTKTTYQDPFSNKAYEQSYHQFAFSYRENYNKRISLGLKLGYLSGIAYQSGGVKSSNLGINTGLDSYEINFTGNFKSTLKEGESFSSAWMPSFKNPGLAFTASANFKLKNGWFLMANLKDIGFIHWTKNPQRYQFSQQIIIDNASANDADERLKDAIDNSFEASNLQKKSFTTPLNSKIEFLVNRDLGKYQPNLLLSKNIWYPGGSVTLINNLVFKNRILSLSPSYNLMNYLDVGFQYLRKTPNWEFFIGSDQLLKTIELIKGTSKSDPALLKGQLGAGIYIGLSSKFGRILEHPANARDIPGLEPADKEKAERTTWLQRLFKGRREIHKKPKQ